MSIKFKVFVECDDKEARSKYDSIENYNFPLYVVHAYGRSFLLYFNTRITVTHYMGTDTKWALRCFLSLHNFDEKLEYYFNTYFKDIDELSLLQNYRERLEQIRNMGFPVSSASLYSDENTFPEKCLSLVKSLNANTLENKCWAYLKDKSLVCDFPVIIKASNWDILQRLFERNKDSTTDHMQEEFIYSQAFGPSFVAYDGFDLVCGEQDIDPADKFESRQLVLPWSDYTFILEARDSNFFIMGCSAQTFRITPVIEELRRVKPKSPIFSMSYFIFFLMDVLTNKNKPIWGISLEYYPKYLSTDAPLAVALFNMVGCKAQVQTNKLLGKSRIRVQFSEEQVLLFAHQFLCTYSVGVSPAIFKVVLNIEGTICCKSEGRTALIKLLPLDLQAQVFDAIEHCRAFGYGNEMQGIYSLASSPISNRVLNSCMNSNDDLSESSSKLEVAILLEVLPLILIFSYYKVDCLANLIKWLINDCKDSTNYYSYISLHTLFAICFTELKSKSRTIDSVDKLANLIIEALPKVMTVGGDITKELPAEGSLFTYK